LRRGGKGGRRGGTLAGSAPSEREAWMAGCLSLRSAAVQKLSLALTATAFSLT